MQGTLRGSQSGDGTGVIQKGRKGKEGKEGRKGKGRLSTEQFRVASR